MALVNIIKYEGDNTTFVWKHKKTDFNTMSQLIVHENQEAVLFKNGQALDLFEAGRYTLKTENIPILRRLINIPAGGRTPFHCEVYFINKTHQMAIKWGTDSQVQYMDPTYKFPLQIGASGEMVLSVCDAKKLLVKVVGTEKVLTQDRLVQKFRSFLMSKVKPYIAAAMQNASYSIFEVDSHMAEFSSNLHAVLTPDFKEYGISLEKFFVTTIAKPEEDDAYIKFKDIHFRQYSDVAEAKLKQQTDLIYARTEAQKTVIESQAMAQKRAHEGYTYQQERGFDVATAVARNEAVGQFTNLGVGLGTMAGVGGVVAGTVGGAMNDALSQAAPANSAAKCMKCGAPLPQNAKFCLECGEKVAPAFPENMIVCPECGSTVAKGKFCLECGHKFITACPNCGKETIPGAKFCLECGQKL